MRRIGLAVLVLSVACAIPASAAQADYNFKIFGGVAYVSPLSDSSVEGIADSVEASDEIGYEIGAEWKPFDRFGFELSYVDVNHDVEADGTVIGEIGFTPINLTLNFHVINSDRFAWYIGPTASWVDWGEVELIDGDEVDTDSETTFGVSTGIDIGLGEKFAIVGGLRWLDSSVDAEGEEVSVDPLFARLGVAFRF